jgi:hypothetical protein
MKTRAIVLALVCTVGVAQAQPPAFRWQHSIGTPGGEGGFDIVPTRGGGYAVAGERTDPVSGGVNAWFLRLSPSGRPVAEASYDAGTNETLLSVVQTRDGGFAFAGDFATAASPLTTLVLKTDSAGSPLWSRRYPGPLTVTGGGPRPGRVIESANGDLILVSSGALPTGGQSLFALAARLSPTGVPLWSFGYRDARFSPDGSGAGFYDAIEAPSATGGAPDIIAVGYTARSANGPREVLFVRLSGAGNVLDARVFTTPATNLRSAFATGVADVFGSGFTLAGTYTDSATPVGAFLIRTGPAGAPAAARVYPRMIPGVSSLAELPTPTGLGRVELAGTGQFNPLPVVDPGVALLSVDGALNPLGVRVFGRLGEEVGLGAERTSDLGMVLVGTNRTFAFGDRDLYVIKTDRALESGCNEQRFSIQAVDLPTTDTRIDLVRAEVGSVETDLRRVPSQSLDNVLCLRCPADLNQDGVVDFNDLLEYLNLYNAQDPRADWNGDGVVDFNDLLEFLNFYNQPC